MRNSTEQYRGLYRTSIYFFLQFTFATPIFIAESCVHFKMCNSNFTAKLRVVSISKFATRIFTAKIRVVCCVHFKICTSNFWVSVKLGTGPEHLRTHPEHPRTPSGQLGIPWNSPLTGQHPCPRSPLITKIRQEIIKNQIKI